MKRLIFLKLIKDFTIFFLIVVFSITLIIWFLQAVNYLDYVSEDGHSLKVYFLYTALSLPKIISKIFPFIFFISLFYMILKYEENNELQIFWLIGINKIDFINTITKYSLLFLIIQFFLTIYLVPNAQDLARSFIRSSNIDYFSSLIKEKQFNDTVANLTIYVESKNDRNELVNVFLKDNIDIENSQIIYAKKGNIIKVDTDNYLVLYEGQILNKNKNKTNIFSFEKTEFNLSKYTTKTITTQKIQEYSSKKLLTCLYGLIISKAANNEIFIGCSNRSIKALKREILKRFIMPLYIPLLALISSMVILVSKDHQRFSKNKFFTFGFALVMIVFSELSTRSSGDGNLKNMIIILCPILFFLIIKKILTVKLQNNYKGNHNVL